MSCSHGKEKGADTSVDMKHKGQCVKRMLHIPDTFLSKHQRYLSRRSLTLHPSWHMSLLLLFFFFYHNPWTLDWTAAGMKQSKQTEYYMRKMQSFGSSEDSPLAFYIILNKGCVIWLPNNKKNFHDGKGNRKWWLGYSHDFMKQCSLISDCINAKLFCFYTGPMV